MHRILSLSLFRQYYLELLYRVVPFGIKQRCKLDFVFSQGVQDIFAQIAVGFVKMAAGNREHFLKIYRQAEDGNMTNVANTLAARNVTIRLIPQNEKPKSWWRRRC